MANVNAPERRGGNANDRHRVLVNQHLTAHYIRSACELRLPEVVSEHNHRIRTGCPVIVAPHGIDHTRFSPVALERGADAAALAALGIDPAAAHVVSVGTLEPRKGILELLEAFERLAPDHPKLELVFAGQRGWGLNAFDRRLAASPVRERITVLGYVPDDAIAALLRHAAVVAYPSADEGFGLPALEALACGAPLVTTAGSVMASLGGDAPWFAESGDAASLASALTRVLDASDEETHSRRDAGVQRAASFSWDMAADRHLEAYRLAIGQSGRGRAK